MEAPQHRIELLGRSLSLLATYAIVAGAASILMDLGGIADGETVALIRGALGLVGIATGTLVWTLRRMGIDGWQALAAWSVAQVPFVAWSLDGNALRQVWDLLLGFSSETTVNGVVTASEGYGFNGVGVILAIWTWQTRDRWERRVKPALDRPTPA
jgi:hypothetical protein